jgi:D-sedoheptulose 7-phosphate isomerase
MLKDYLATSAAIISRTAETLEAARMNTAIALAATALTAGKPLLVCGNGGSAADAMHITGELVGRFLRNRRALKVICLSSNPSVLTAWANDFSFDTVFSRQVEAYAEPGGVILGLTTSGNSPNVIKAFEVARARGMDTIAMTGEGGSKIAALATVLLDVPSRSTPLIQQVHICLYHYFCERLEADLAGPD